MVPKLCLVIGHFITMLRVKRGFFYPESFRVLLSDTIFSSVFTSHSTVRPTVGVKFQNCSYVFYVRSAMDGK